jgi:hypothetical protein
MTDHEPVGQMLNSVLTTLDDIVVMVLRPEDYDEIAAEKVRIGQIISRAQLILTFIEGKQSIPKRVWNRRRRVI